MARRKASSSRWAARRNPAQVYEWFIPDVIAVPDVVEFVCSDRYLDRPNLYPRQATLLKTVFLQDELFTPYDYEVLEQWAEGFHIPGQGKDLSHYHGHNGICPDVLERIGLCKAEGRHWFSEFIAVIGRRGSKGLLGALCMAYVLWHYLTKGDPQRHYGIDRDKRLEALIFAGKLEQAKAFQWRDLANVIVGGPCYEPYISSFQAESLTVYAPSDFRRLLARDERGIGGTQDLATFAILPKESTGIAGRGPASFCLDPQTPVLTADLHWVPIGDLRCGDRVVGIDEFPERPRAQRKLRDAQVLAAWTTRKPALRLTFEDGSGVICSRDHRWLFKDFGKGGGYLWREASKLEPGSRIRHLVDPWAEDRSWEGGYLAGFFNGEGCVSGYRGRVAEQWELGSVAESITFLGSIRPSRLMTKQKLVWEGVAPRGGATPNGRIRPNGFKTIVAIEPLPEQELVDITTSTRTFIANGLVSHNCQAFDEMAHVVSSIARADAETVYDSATPALDQFGVDGFKYPASSPWQMIGKFYELYQQALEIDPATNLPVHHDKLMVQLTSWDPYVDWEITQDRVVARPPLAAAEDSPARPVLYFAPLSRAIQTYDDNLRRLEKANPETFRVERKSQWAAALDAYFDPAKVAEMFIPWVTKIGTDSEGNDVWVPHTLPMQERGLLHVAYKGHADPGQTNSRFAVALGHAETGPDGYLHVVFDYIQTYEAGDERWSKRDPVTGEVLHILDYTRVEPDVWQHAVLAFAPFEFTMDQYAGPSLVDNWQAEARKAHLPRAINIFERTANHAGNWARAECMKWAMNLGFIHSPYHEVLELECKFLQDLGNHKVDHPTSGPVQTKDCYDAAAEVIYTLIGEQVQKLAAALSSAPRAAIPTDDQQRRQASGREDVHEVLSGLGRGRAPGQGHSRMRRR